MFTYGSSLNFVPDYLRRVRQDSLFVSEAPSMDGKVRGTAQHNVQSLSFISRSRKTSSFSSCATEHRGTSAGLPPSDHSVSAPRCNFIHH